MKVLRGVKCNKCGGDIGVISYYDKESKSTVVSHGCCVDCSSNVCLPQERYMEFIRENCVEGDAS